MEMRWKSCLFVVALHLAFAGAAHAVDKDKPSVPLTVTSVVLHADAPKAEMCLTLSVPADVKDRARLVSILELKKEGKKQKINASDLSLTPTNLCLQNLDHRKTYQLTLTKLDGVEGQKLAAPFTTTFNVPDRKQILTFVGSTRLPSMPRHVPEKEHKTGDIQLLRSGMAHVVRSVNVVATHLMLYRVTDREAFAGAWQQFRQINLSPSESQTFARTKGQLVFESDLVFGEAPNEEQTLVAPLPADEALAPGLYYLAAMPRGKEGSNPALFAGQWFLVSDLRLTASRVPDGVQVFASTLRAEPKPMAGASVSLLARDGRVLGEIKTKEDGSAFLALKDEDLKSLSLIAGQADSGDVDLLEIGEERAVRLDDLSHQAQIMLNRSEYRTDETAVATLYGEDQSGKLLDTAGSTLKLLRPDRSLHHEWKFEDEKAAVFVQAIPLPIVGSSTLWTLSWVNKNGALLAEVPLPIRAMNDTKTESLTARQAATLEGEKKGAQPQNNNGIEIKPLFGEASFAENSLASFTVSSRGLTGELYYTVYEEGRSFDWLMAEGHWDYKRLPHQRRLGGGHLELSTTEPSLVRWPVTAGHYVLEIANAQGDVQARYAFEAGRAIPRAVKNEEARLRFVQPQQKIEQGKTNELKLVLAEPAVVNVIVTDGKVRQTIHRFMKAGENSLTVAPQEGWGAQLLIRAEALFASQPEPVVARQRVGVHNAAKDIVFKTVAPSLIQTGGVFALFIQIQKTAGDQQTFATAIITPYANGAGKAASAPIAANRVVVDKDGKAELSFDLPAYQGKATLRLLAWNEKQFGSSAFDVQIKPAISLDGKLPEKIDVGARHSFSVALMNNTAPAGVYDYMLTVPEGVVATAPLKGKVKIAKNGQSTLALPLAFPRGVDGLLRVEITGSNGQRIAEQSWPVFVRGQKELPIIGKSEGLNPQQKKTLSLGGEAISPIKNTALIAPVALPDVTKMLYRFVEQEPSSTEDIALWLEAARLWEKPLVTSGLIGETRLATLRTARLVQLQTRQNEDGGFAPTQGGEPSSILSTAAALMALAGRADGAASWAADWLSIKMQNTWFDESERPMRAIAFEALARVKRVDISALRYFAETTRDKKTPPFFPAVLALALERGGDADAAGAWQQKAQEKMDSLSQSDKLRILHWSAQGSMQSVDDVAARLVALDLVELNKNQREMSLYLLALASLADRAGTWRLAIGDKEDKHGGIYPLPLVQGTEKDKGIEIRNASERSLHLLLISAEENKKAKK